MSKANDLASLIADGVIGTAELDTGAITLAKLSDNAVNADKLDETDSYVIAGLDVSGGQIHDVASVYRGASATTQGGIGLGTDGSVSFMNAETEGARFSGEGRLGLGTQQPLGIIDIEDSVSPMIRMSYGGATADHKVAWDSAGMVISADTGATSELSYISMQVFGGERLRITHTGDVNVGRNVKIGGALDVGTQAQLNVLTNTQDFLMGNGILGPFLANDAAVDLGRYNGRFKDLWLSGTANAANLSVTNTGNGGLSFSNENGQQWFLANNPGNSNALTVYHYNNGVYDGGKFVVQSDGYVGIGDTTPTSVLTVSGDSINWAGRFENTRTTGYGVLALVNHSNAGQDILEARNSSGTQFLVQGDGNVGINTGSPAYKLAVNGGTEAFGITLSNSPRMTMGADGTWNYIKGQNGQGFRFSTTGAGDVLTLTNGGNVGIGTSTPANLLELDANSGANAGITIRMGTGNSGANDSFIGFENSAGTEIFRTRFDNPAETYVVGSDTNPDILTVQRAGNVGIGTITPGNLLYVNGDTRLGGGQDYGSTTILSVAPGTVTFDAPGIGGGRLKIDGSTGNVGIGTISPAYKLHTSGTSGFFGTFGEDTVVTGADGIISTFSNNNNNSSVIRVSAAADATDTLEDKFAGIELIGKGFGSTHGRHAWIAAEGVSGSAFRTKLKFKVRGDTNSGYTYRGATIEAPTIMTLDGNGLVGIGTSSPSKSLHVNGSVFFAHGGSTVSRSANGVGISYTNDNAYAANSDIGDGNRFFAVTNDSNTENDYAALSLRVNPNGTNGNANAMLDMKLVSQAGAASKFVVAMRNNETSTFNDALEISHRGDLTIGRGGALLRKSSNSDEIRYGRISHIRNVSTGASGSDVRLMRIKRSWWGNGNFEIIVRGTYYSGSDDSNFQIQGHSSIQYTGTMVATLMYGDTASRLYLSARQTGSPADAYTGYQDLYITVPAYNQFTIEIITSNSSWVQNDTELLTQSNGYYIA